MNHEGEEKELNLKKTAKIVGSIIVSIWIISLLILGIWVSNGNEIGDSFGAVNALFSGLALAGIILTILMQKDELKLQRRELELTRYEMEMTRKEFVTQNQTMKLQQFENTFFQMLNMFYQSTEKLKYRNLDDRYVGKEIFEVYNKNMDFLIRNKAEENINIEIFNRGEYNPKVEKEILILGGEDILSCINEVQGWYNNAIYSYYTTFITILKLIRNSQVDNKIFYASILQSNLSVKEKIVIFYKCISEDEFNEFNVLVEELNILGDLSAEIFTSNFLKSELKKYQ